MRICKFDNIFSSFKKGEGGGMSFLKILFEHCDEMKIDLWTNLSGTNVCIVNKSLWHSWKTFRELILGLSYLSAFYIFVSLFRVLCVCEAHVFKLFILHIASCSQRICFFFFCFSNRKGLWAFQQRPYPSVPCRNNAWFRLAS